MIKEQENFERNPARPDPSSRGKLKAKIYGLVCVLQHEIIELDQQWHKAKQKPRRELLRNIYIRGSPSFTKLLPTLPKLTVNRKRGFPVSMMKQRKAAILVESSSAQQTLLKLYLTMGSIFRHSNDTT